MRLGWCGGGQPVGEKEKQPFQLSFNSSLRVDFQGARVTSDGGLILVRELDERLGLSALVQRHLSDSRRGKNTQLPLIDLLRQSVYSRLAGYEDVNDAAYNGHFESTCYHPLLPFNREGDCLAAKLRPGFLNQMGLPEEGVFH